MSQVGRVTKPSASGARRGNTLSSTLGFGERLFASGEERRFIDDIEQGLDKVETALRIESRFADNLADVTSRYLLDAGGKRVRPVLTLLTAQLGDGTNADVVQAATAVEMTHLASLYHDDVMDDAEMRRGVPTAQNVWGNSVAILTGDLLFARASKLIANLGERALVLQAETFERLCLGQLHETIGPRDDEDPIEHYLQVLADKTGSLIATAAQVGTIFSNAPDVYTESVSIFGEKVGVAFQLVDDVIDLAPGVGVTGKKPGTDLRAGVATLPLLYLRRAARTDHEAAALLDSIELELARSFAGDHDDEHLTTAIDALREHDVTRDTLTEARRWAAEAVAALDPLPDGAVKKALIRFAETVVDRTT